MFGLSGLIWCVDVTVKLWGCIFFKGCENIKIVDVQRCPRGASQAGDKLARPKSVARCWPDSETRAAKAKSAGDVDLLSALDAEESVTVFDGCVRGDVCGRSAAL